MVRTKESATASKVVTTARELFYSEGYDVTVDRISHAAKVAKPTVYAHFASKETLVAAALEDNSQQFFTQLELEMKRHADDPVAQLLAPFDLLAADLPNAGYHGCMCLNAAATFTDPAHPAHGIFARLEDQLSETWATAAEALRVPDPASLARQLLLLFDGVKARGIIDSSNVAANEAREAALALVQYHRTAGRKRRAPSSSGAGPAR